MDGLGAHHLANAKVPHLDLPLLGQEDVGRLEVTGRVRERESEWCVQKT